MVFVNSLPRNHLRTLRKVAAVVLTCKDSSVLLDVGVQCRMWFAVSMFLSASVQVRWVCMYRIHVQQNGSLGVHAMRCAACTPSAWVAS